MRVRDRSVGDAAAGAVFWLNPTDAPQPAAGGRVLVAQLTVPSGSQLSGLISAQGKSAEGARTRTLFWDRSPARLPSEASRSRNLDPTGAGADWETHCMPWFIEPSDAAIGALSKTATWTTSPAAITIHAGVPNWSPG